MLMPYGGFIALSPGSTRFVLVVPRILDRIAIAPALSDNFRFADIGGGSPKTNTFGSVGGAILLGGYPPSIACRKGSVQGQMQN